MVECAINEVILEIKALIFISCGAVSYGILLCETNNRSLIYFISLRQRSYAINQVSRHEH